MKNSLNIALLMNLGLTRGEALDAVESAEFYLMHDPNRHRLITNLITAWINYTRSPGGAGINDTAAFICSRIKRLRQPPNPNYELPEDLQMDFVTILEFAQPHQAPETPHPPVQASVVRRS